ncbi:unannotated protein [freshwater metagenome]|uniref:Unannotated protein n=1 Tax=freshwater metagenome TaxID=449393 RepID=A0A6J7KIY1_9ZZZZ
MYVFLPWGTTMGRAVTDWSSSMAAMFSSVTGSTATNVVNGCGPYWSMHPDIAPLP